MMKKKMQKKPKKSRGNLNNKLWQQNKVNLGQCKWMSKVSSECVDAVLHISHQLLSQLFVNSSDQIFHNHLSKCMRYLNGL